MKKTHIIAILVIVVLALALYFMRRGSDGVAVINLVDLFPGAAKASTMPADQALHVKVLDVGGDSRTAIFMHPTSRLTYKDVLVPDDAWLRAWVALDPAMWDKGGDGVLFRFGVSDGRSYEEFVNLVVDPAHNPNDRKWQPVMVDLSAFAGMRVDLIFNTNSSPPGRPASEQFDWAYWGSPEVIVQR
ncbi:MAG: hypothetical protein KJ061_10690 [Vicinamibacteraceae bacterium]|nr:hypothetical protein [Vicinamibacteraceae bacterium]